MQEGIYSINTYSNVNAGLDVAYFSKDYGARLIVAGVGGSNNQLFQFTPKGSGWQVRGCDSSNMLDSNGQDWIFPNTTNVKYQQLIMMWDSQSGGQVWYVENVAGKTVNINGESLQVVRIKNGSGMYLCCPGGNVSDRWNLNYAIVKDNDPSDITEWWVLRKNAYQVNGAVPADLKAATSHGGVESSYITGSGACELHPTFVCPPDHRYQIRWRWRGRLKGTNSFSAWSAWKSPSGAITDDGWGNVWAANDIINDIPRGRRYGTPIPASCALDTYDKREYTYEVRIGGTGAVSGRLGISYGSSNNSGSASVTIPTYYRPVFNVTGCTMTPEGLAVSYASDYQRNNNTVRIGPIYISGRAITQWTEFYGQPYAGTVVIPPNKLAFVPGKGAAWSTQSYLVNNDGIQFFYGSHTGTVGYSTGFSNSIAAPSVSSAAGNEVLVTFGASSAGHAVTLVYQEGKKNVSVACEQVSSTVFRVLPPSNKEYDIVWNSTGSGTTWATGTIHRPAISLRNYMWSFNGTYVQAYLFDGKADAPHSVTRDYAAEVTQGRKFESVFFGKGSKGSITIDCIVPIKEDVNNPHATIEDMRLLLSSEYAVFRSPDGRRHDVAITGMDDQRVFNGLYSVNVSMVECDNE